MFARKKILIVEDNALNRAMLVEIISDQYTALEAENGKDALKILLRDQEEIALILLDVIMPVMDGYTFLDIIKKDPRLSLIPVIITTQSSSEDDEVAALAHGANDFVPKPYRSKVILHRIANAIRLREADAMISQLQEIGCDYVQGCLLSKPVPASEYDAMLLPFSRETVSPLPSVPSIVQTKPLLLVAEEDPACRKLLQAAFADIYEVVPAVNCAQALDFLSGHAHDLTALILSSTLPEPGASVIVSALRRATAPRRIPILIIAPTQQVPEVQKLGLDVEAIANKPRETVCLHCLRRRVEWMNALTAYQSRECSMISEACRDYLTGLLNRRGFQTALDSIQKEDFPVAVFLFDLDNLKLTNDQMGHGAGDQLLKHFADVLRQNTRSSDILCRYGGDEFAVILKQIHSEDAVIRKGASICRSMSQAPFPDGSRAACSGGVVLCRTEGVPPAVLIERADQALYQAKRHQKGYCILWKPEFSQ